MPKTFAVPFVCFIDAENDEQLDEKISAIQVAVSNSHAGRLLQDEVLDPVRIEYEHHISSVIDMPDTPLFDDVRGLVAATSAPWRTLSNEPDAMKYIERLHDAAKKVRESFQGR